METQLSTYTLGNHALLSFDPLVKKDIPQIMRKLCLKFLHFRSIDGKVIPYIGNFSRREILAKMPLGRCVKFSMSPFFTISRTLNEDVYFTLCLFLAILGRSRTQQKFNPREKFMIYGILWYFCPLFSVCHTYFIISFLHMCLYLWETWTWAWLHEQMAVTLGSH